MISEGKIASVILDANFLMAPGELGVDIFEEMERVLDAEYELLATEPVKREVQKLSKGRGEDSKAARIALELMERNGVEIVETNRRDGDASVIELARKVEEPVVATNDKNLRKQFRSRSVPTLFIRSKDHVEMEGELR